MKNREAFVLINQLIGIGLANTNGDMDKKLIELAKWTKKLLEE